MSELAKREENGTKGETRTQAILIDYFWVLKRSVDVEGADLLLQIPADSLDELWERKSKIQVLGVIQAKYFEGNNQVKIQKKYVENNSGHPRTDFFAMLHSNDEDGENVQYFFTANEVQKEFYEDKKKEYYCFSLTKDRDYANFKNKKKKHIGAVIKEGILKTEQERNKELIEIIYVNTPQSNINTYNTSPTTKVIETNNEIHKLEQKGNIIEITKTCKVTGTTIVVGSELGNIENTDYDPFSGVTTAKDWI